MNTVNGILNEMPMDELTQEELDHLDQLGVGMYLGRKGADFLEETLKTKNYDPASAAGDVRTALGEINTRLSQFTELRSSLGNLKFTSDEIVVDNHLAEIRVRFQSDASIDDVVLLKAWSSDWHDIMRGVAMCVGEKPEDVMVVGTSNGSIIICLAGTVAVTGALVKIVQNIGKITHEVLTIANTVEDLRHKKILNREIEDTFKKRRDEIIDNGVGSTVDAVLDGKVAKGDVKSALKKSVEKYLNFNQKGGDVDFIPPKEEELYDGDGDGDSGEKAQEIIALNEGIALLRDAVEEMRTQKAEILMLSDQRDGTDG